MLSKLSLATNDLQALPAAVGHLQALEELDLSFNQLCELPETIGKLKKLKTLNCEWNRLQNVPASFSRCTAMERLLLNDNCLEKVCDLSRLFGLRDLCLHNNRLSTLPAGVETLRRLRSVRLEGNAWPLQMRKAALQGTEAVLSLLRGDSVHREEEAVAACRDQGKKEGSRPNRESSALGRRTEVPSAGTVLQGHQGEGGDGVNKVETGGGAGGGFMQRTEATETEKVVSFRRGMEEDKSPPRLLPPPSSLVPPSSSSSAEATPVSFRDLLEDLEERQRKHAELDKRVQRSTGDLGRAGRKKATGAFKKIFPSGAREDSMQPEKNATVSLSRLLLDPLCLPASKNNRRSPPPPLTQAPPSNQSLPLPPGLVCLESGSGSRVKIWEDPSVSSHDKGRAPQGPPRGRGLQERNARTRRNRSPMQQSGQMNLSATSCAAAQRGSLRPSSLKEQTPETAPQSLLSEKGLRHRVPLHGLSKRKGKEAYTDSAPPASPRACRSRAADTERGHRGPPEFSSRESGTVTASTTASGSFCVSMQQSTNCIFRRSTKESASRFESSASHEEAAVQTCTEKEEPRCAVGWTEEEKEEKIEVLVPVQPASSRSPSLPTLSVTQTLPSSPEASPSPPKGSLSVWKKGTDESSREAARKGIGWDMWQTTGKNTEEIGHGGDIKEGETSEKPRGEAMAGPTDADMTQEVCGVLREEGGKERIEQDEGGGAVLRRLKEMAANAEKTVEGLAEACRRTRQRLNEGRTTDPPKTPKESAKPPTDSARVLKEKGVRRQEADIPSGEAREERGRKSHREPGGTPNKSLAKHQCQTKGQETETICQSDLAALNPYCVRYPTPPSPQPPAPQSARRRHVSSSGNTCSRLRGSAYALQKSPKGQPEKKETLQPRAPPSKQRQREEDHPLSTPVPPLRDSSPSDKPPSSSINESGGLHRKPGQREKEKEGGHMQPGVAEIRVGTQTPICSVDVEEDYEESQRERVEAFLQRRAQRARERLLLLKEQQKERESIQQQEEPNRVQKTQDCTAEQHIQRPPSKTARPPSVKPAVAPKKIPIQKKTIQTDFTQAPSPPPECPALPLSINATVSETGRLPAMSIDAPASPSAFYQSVAPQIQAILASSTFEKDATTQNDSRSNTQSQGWQRDSHQLQRKTRDTRAVKQQKDTAADSNSRNTPAAPAPVRGTRLRPTPWKRPVVSVGKSSRPPVPGSSSPSALTETETALGPDSGTRLALSLSQTARKGRGKEGGSLGVSKRREARAAGEMQRETEELLCVNRELRSLYSQEAQEQVARRRRGSSGACRGPSSFVPGSSSREEEDAHGEADDDAAIVEGIMRGRGIEQRVLHGFLQEVISEPTTRAPYLAEALEVPRQSSQSIPEPDTGFSEHQNKLLSTRESLSLSQQKSHSADLLRDPEDSDGRMAEQQGCVTEDRKSRIQTTALRSEGLVKSRDGEDSQSDDEQNGECAVCFCGPKDTLIAPCGHVCCCLSCAREVMARGDRCPVCRAPIEDVFRVFRA